MVTPIICPRMHTIVPEGYCGTHPVHCKGCPLLPEGRSVNEYQHREWFQRPVTWSGFEFAARYTSESGHAEFRARKGGSC